MMIRFTVVCIFLCIDNVVVIYCSAIIIGFGGFPSLNAVFSRKNIGIGKNDVFLWHFKKNRVTLHAVQKSL